MVILKKLRAATLIETLVASAIIVIVFVVGSLIITNIFQGSISSDNSQLKTRMTELEYLVIHNKVSIPFYEETAEWDITIENKETVFAIIGLNKRNDQKIFFNINE